MLYPQDWIRRSNAIEKQTLDSQRLEKEGKRLAAAAQAAITATAGAPAAAAALPPLPPQTTGANPAVEVYAFLLTVVHDGCTYSSCTSQL